MLEKINSIKDLQKFRKDELQEVVDELRALLLLRISQVGGHLASNLGIIELTVALHYVFDEQDKFVFDGSHQSYTHKIITGRREAFSRFKETNEFSGLFDKNESKHDDFFIGHTSNSISLACGLAKGRDFLKKNERIFAVIGDGSLSGSEAYSGLNNAAMLCSQFGIIFNDNEQSIANNVGGIYCHFADLRKSQGKKANNFFENLGFKYVYIEAGNNVEILVDELEKVKFCKEPIVIHVHTQKGYGYFPAINNKEKYHFVDPFNIEDGIFLYDDVPGTYKRLISDYLINKTYNNSDLIVLNSGIPTILDLVRYRELFPNNYIDTGICEDTTISIAAGLSQQGIFPVVLQLSSFSQRMYDQLAQDIALNKLPLLLIVEGAGFSNTNASHVGIFDMALFSHIPNFVYMTPRNGLELCKMMDYAFEKKATIGIRLPNGRVHNDVYPVAEILDYKYEIVKKGTQVAILALGDFFRIGVDVYSRLSSLDINATLVNPRFINVIDKETLVDLLSDHSVFVVVENSVQDGGFGSRISTFLSKYKVRVFTYAFDNVFYDRRNILQELEKQRMTGELIVEDILNVDE